MCEPAGTAVSGWLDAWAPAVSVYAVPARGTADVVAAVNFARRNLRLVVKGVGIAIRAHLEVGLHSNKRLAGAPAAVDDAAAEIR